ncbi:MAG TPA: type II secretion system F family protein [Streptosporangiaceae bacterium]|jgi:tight adherence protein C|nr:type II secretion system F family protein [Streptosporangiaceae bacterium]
MFGSGLLYGGTAALVLAVVALAVALMPKRRGTRGVSQALAAIDRRYTRDNRTGGRTGGAGHLQLPDWLSDVAVRLSPGSVRTSLQRRLDVAGNPEGWTPDRVLASKALCLVVLGSIGALLALRHPALLVVTGGAGAAAGFFLPDVLVYNSGLKRQQRLAISLPEGLDLLTICVEAGLGFDAALAQVARNLKGPLAAEFARVLQEMQIGKSRAEAMRALAERTSLPELRAFVSALTQSAELGIPVASVLREQAKEMRVRRRQRAEAQAQKVPVKMTFPLIGCMLPALFVVVVGAGIIEIAHSLFHLH